MRPAISTLIGRGIAMLALAGALVLVPLASAAHDAIRDQIASVTAQIARSPANPELLVRRAELYRAARQWPAAHADLDRATTLDSSLTTAGLARAHLFLDSGNPKAAADAASRFLDRQPGHADALLVRARARVRLGLAQSATADFSLALDARPLPDVYIERARATMAPGGSGREEALRGLDQGIARLGPVVTLELKAIDIELKLTRYDAALARLDKVSAQAARKESWLARRAAILEQAGQLNEAHTTYRATLDSTTSKSDRARQTRASAALIDQLRADIDRLDLNKRPSGQNRQH